MSNPPNGPHSQIPKFPQDVAEGLEDSHDQDLIEWLATFGIRPPDWTIDPCVFDQEERRRTGEKPPQVAKSLGDFGCVPILQSIQRRDCCLVRG